MQPIHIQNNEMAKTTFLNVRMSFVCVCVLVAVATATLFVHFTIAKCVC